MVKFKTNNFLYATSWIINIILAILVFGVFEKSFYRIYYNSDTLYLASIYKDIFIDGTGFKGWNLNAAPNFFPDMLLYFIVRFFTGDFRIAYMVFSILQYNILLFLLSKLLVGIKPNINKNYITLFNLIFPLYLLATILYGSFEYTFDVFSQSYHNGCFINTLVALNFFIRYTKKGKQKYLLAMILFVLLGAFNDRLFIVTFTVPVTAVLLLNVIFIKKRTLTIGSLSTIGATALALIIFNVTKSNSIYQCIGLGSKFMNFSNSRNSFKNLIAQHTDFILSGNIRGWITILTIISFFTLLVLLLKMIKDTQWFKKKNKNTVIYASFILFSLVSVFLTLFTPVINGYYLGNACIRYTTLSFFFSLFNVAFIVFFLTMDREKNWLSFFIKIISALYLVIIIHTVATKPVISNLKSVANYYPEKVRIADEFATKHNLQYGVGGYWNAKLITMFSKNDLRVYTAINHKMNLWYHVMNSNWYYDYDKGKYKNPVFNFVVSGKWDNKDFYNEFAQPIDSAMYKKEGFVFLVPDFKYNRSNKKPYFLKSKINKPDN